MTHSDNNPEDHREFAPDGPRDGEDEVLRSGGGDEETDPEHPEAGEGLSASTVGEARGGGIKFKTYRYKGWLPSRRLVLGKELLAAIIAAVVVYVSLVLLLVMAGFFSVPLDFLDPLAERGLLRLDLMAFLVGICVLFCRLRYRLAWRKHLLGAK